MTAALSNLFVIAAPSGAGKTTLVASLVEALPNVSVSISHTTRAKRPHEIEGVHYYFIDPAQFKKMVARDEFLEYAHVFENYYGTSKTWVKEMLKQGKDVILEIDWQGCQQIKKIFPQAIAIFILPPSLQVLQERLIKRNQDDASVIEKRLIDVQETIQHLGEFDYLVINDDFPQALADLKTIILSTHLRTPVQTNRHAGLIQSLKKI